MAGESGTKGKTSDAIKKLMGLQAKTARVIRNNITADIAIDEVVRGDIIHRPSGRKDSGGRGKLSAQFFRGRSDDYRRKYFRWEKNAGDMVIGGTVNKNGSSNFSATASWQ